jgi:hypothetical protein
MSMVAGNPKENLIRAIDAYIGADAHTPDTRAVVKDLRNLRGDVEAAPNPVARATGARHADLNDPTDHVPQGSMAAPAVHVHVHTGPPDWGGASDQARKRMR